MELSINEIIIRIGITLLFSSLLGYERSKHNKAAGIVTHSLVAVSTAAIAILQVELYNDSINFVLSNPELVTHITFERQRIVAQVITGIGFLGGGAILKTKSEIRGLTTAATLWASGIVGIIFGMGYYSLGITLSTLILILVYGVKTYIRNKRINRETTEDSIEG
ncbi:MgtC/SapB family protein [Mycoplasmatota bacterium zrk1]